MAARPLHVCVFVYQPGCASLFLSASSLPAFFLLSLPTHTSPSHVAFYFTPFFPVSSHIRSATHTFLSN